MGLKLVLCTNVCTRNLYGYEYVRVLHVGKPHIVDQILLGIGSNPVDDAVLVKVVLVSESEGLPFPQLPHEDERGTVEVVPLLGHLHMQRREEQDKSQRRLDELSRKRREEGEKAVKKR